MDKKYWLLLLALPLLLTACQAVRVPISHTESAQRSIPAEVKQIAILPYEYPPNLPPDFNYVKDLIASQMKDRINQMGSYKILERDQLAKLVKEDILSRGTNLSSEEIHEIGNVSGADAIVVGKIDNLAVTDRLEQKALQITHPQKDPDMPPPPPQTVYYDYRVLNVSMAVTSEMLHVKDKSKIATQSFTDNYNSEADKAVVEPNGIFTDRNSPDYYAGQPGRVPATSAVIERSAQKCAHQFFEQISAHKRDYMIDLMTGSSEAMDHGLDWAKKGQYQDAIREFQNAAATPDDKTPAMYNTAVCYEALGNYSEAINFYNQCSHLSEAKSGIARIRKYHPEL